jgi:hypothetical protein
MNLQSKYHVLIRVKSAYKDNKEDTGLAGTEDLQQRRRSLEQSIAVDQEQLVTNVYFGYWRK